MEHTIQFRVRYSETDQMGTFYNSRALEWFECGRTELLRACGLPYAEMELRVDVEIVQAESGAPVARGYTIHAVTDPTGKPIRPPPWVTEVFAR
jgi:acyl-CoA thioester hydrolase